MRLTELGAVSFPNFYLPPTANLLVTSRHVLSIEDKLNQSPRLEIRASDMDVRIYLEDRIQKESRLRRHVQADPNLRNSIIDTIVKKVQGMLVSHLEYPASRTFALSADQSSEEPFGSPDFLAIRDAQPSREVELPSPVSGIGVEEPV
jgi:hypothetical protein